MKAVHTSDGLVALSMSVAEAVVLYELIAVSEFAEDLKVIELPEPVAQKVMSDIQQSLAPLLPALGSDEYSSTVARAYEDIDPGPYGVHL